ELAAFFQSLGPSLEAIDAGLAAPFLLQPPVEDLRQMQESDAYLYRIVVILAGYGRWEAEQHDSCATGIDRLLDAYRLAQQMSADLQASTTAAIPLQALCLAVHRGNCGADDVQTGLSRLTDAGPPFPDAQTLLENDWRRFQLQADNFLDDSVGSERVGLALFGSRRIDKQVNWIVERKGQLIELAGLRPAELEARLPELGESPDHLWYFGDPVNRLRRMNSTYYQTLSAYETTRLVLALELWKKRDGAYPATLDALVPGILEALPPEPFTGSAYRYTPVEDGYRLDTTAPAPGGGQPTPARVEFHGDVAEAVL
ncbi:MAG: hypothetical protein IT368_06405, partial [Candidatus Hydrogenedentes bacterium]|nr:hypothetical protein [Candidatus Hydrogenedentota bacterium]